MFLGLIFTLYISSLENSSMLNPTAKAIFLSTESGVVATARVSRSSIWRPRNFGLLILEFAFAPFHIMSTLIFLVASCMLFPWKKIFGVNISQLKNVILGIFILTNKTLLKNFHMLFWTLEAVPALSLVVVLINFSAKFVWLKEIISWIFVNLSPFRDSKRMKSVVREGKFCNFIKNNQNVLRSHFITDSTFFQIILKVFDVYLLKKKIILLVPWFL